jgi:prevent-host-death family protein
MTGHEIATLATVKARLTRMVRKVENGHSIVVTKRGKKVAALVPFDTFEGLDRGDRILEVLQRYAPRHDRARRGKG